MISNIIAKIKQLITNFKNWYGYLIICGLFLIVGNTCYSAGYAQNFDSLSPGEDLANWYGDGIVQGGIYNSAPYALDIDYDDARQGTMYTATSSSWSFVSFDWYYNDISSGADFIFHLLDTSTSTRAIAHLRMKPNRAGNDATIGYLNGTSFATSTVVQETLMEDTWYKIDIEYDTDLEKVRARIDNGTWSAWVGLSYTYTGLDQIFWQLNTHTSAKVYIDNVSLDGADLINFTDNIANGNLGWNIIYDGTNPLSFRNETICYIDYGYCYIYALAWPSDAGNTAYIYSEEEPLVWLDDVVISDYLNPSGFVPIRFTINDIPTTTGTYYYGAYLDRNNDGFTADDRFTNHIKVIYRTVAEEEQFLVDYYDAQECEKLNIVSENCSNIATSTDWLNISYALQCGMQTVAYKLVGVSTSTCRRFLTAVDQFANSFPFNLIYNIASTTKNSGSSATSSANVVIAPLKWYNSTTHTYEETGANLLTNKTFEQGMGATLYNFYYLWFERLIWILCYGYILFRVYRMANPHLSAQFGFGPLTERRERFYKHRVKEYKTQRKYLDIQLQAQNMMRRK